MALLCLTAGGDDDHFCTPPRGSNSIGQACARGRSPAFKFTNPDLVESPGGGGLKLVCVPRRTGSRSEQLVDVSDLRIWS